jgi:hypothetical protein
MASNKFNLAEYNDSPCATQIFRMCSDIRIDPIPSQPAYVSTPFTVPDKEPVFNCRKHRLDRGGPTGDTPGPLLYNGQPDSSKGRHMVCVMPETHPNFNDTNTNFLRNTWCPNCYNNCFAKSDGSCPSDCYCSWFNRYPGTNAVQY